MFQNSIQAYRNHEQLRLEQPVAGNETHPRVSPVRPQSYRPQVPAQARFERPIGPNRTDKNSIYVGNLAETITRGKLMGIFNQFGRVMGADVFVRPLANRNGYATFGFVDFAFEEHATRAIYGMNNRVIDGRVIRVEARESEETLPRRFNDTNRAVGPRNIPNQELATGVYRTPARRMANAGPAPIVGQQIGTGGRLGSQPVAVQSEPKQEGHQQALGPQDAPQTFIPGSPVAVQSGVISPSTEVNPRNQPDAGHQAMVPNYGQPGFVPHGYYVPGQTPSGMVGPSQPQATNGSGAPVAPVPYPYGSGQISYPSYYPMPYYPVPMPYGPVNGTPAMTTGPTPPASSTTSQTAEQCQVNHGHGAYGRTFHQA